ncbi:MAG: hypothetical protein KatS3mg102_2708 [Planctomycetota bacterium]|nr:MAG: hypothetical protein KatS3mg102_2708 [Planctomycetota bacterium]
MGTSRPVSLELTIAPAGGGEPVPLDVSLRVAPRRGGGLEVQAIGRDLRPRRALEQRTMQAERLRTAIQLAGAAAHHINQPLTGIIGFCDLLLASEACSPEQREMVAAIRQQAERIAEIVARMRGMTQVETENYLGQVNILKL